MATDGLKLGLLQLSAVRELANIGLGHATTALAEMTQRSFNMSVPYAESTALTHIPALLSTNAEAPTVGIYMSVDGDVPGHIAFLFQWESACSLWRMLLGTAPASPAEIGELEASAMLEIGNIINGSFLNAIADMTNFRLLGTPPMLSVDMACSILESVVTEASEGDCAALAIETRLHEMEAETGGVFLYIPTVGGLQSVFEALGIAEAA